MCELLGMSFNIPVTPNVSLRMFRYRGEDNPHGWGISFYPDRSAQVIKEPIKAKKSSLSEFIQGYKEIKSRIFIGHVRHTSIGSTSRRNTHPFYREMQGKEYVFAHNGTLINYKELKLGRFKPIGETDSEYIFCHLLNCIENKRIPKWSNEDFEWLVKKLYDINRYGRFNSIFSDGNYLFCYFDAKRYKSLYFIHRKSPYGKIKLLDEDWQINLAEEKDPKQEGYIVATVKLTDEKMWSSFKPGELIVFENGKIIYSNKRSLAEISK